MLFEEKSVNDSMKSKEGLLALVEQLRREISQLTEFKSTQEDLNKTEYIRSQMYRKLMEISPDAVFLADCDMRIIMCNKYAAELCGYRNMQDMIGKQVFDFTAPHQRQEAIDTAEEVLRNVKIRRKEFLVRKKDGDHFCAEVSATTLYDSGGQPQAVLGIVRDITRRKQVEQSLRESERQYRSVLNALPCTLHVVDRSLRFELFNDAFIRRNKELGLATDVIGKKISEVFAFLPVQTYQQYQWVLDNGQPLVADETLTVGNKRITNRVSKLPIFSEGNVSGIITVVYPLGEEDIHG